MDSMHLGIAAALVRVMGNDERPVTNLRF